MGIEDFTFKRTFNKISKCDKKLLYFGERWPSVYNARLRAGCSKPNTHLCQNLHGIDLAQRKSPITSSSSVHTFNAQRVNIFNDSDDISNNI
jgi:hypothetical protein